MVRQIPPTKRLRGDHGFVLLEAMVSIVIITVMMVSLTTLFITTIKTTDAQRARQTAVRLVTEQLDLIRAGARDAIGDGGPEQPISRTVDNVDYQLQSRIEKVRRGRINDDRMINDNKVTVTVSWAGHTYSDAVLVNTDPDPAIGEAFAPPAAPTITACNPARLSTAVSIFDVCHVNGGVPPYTWYGIDLPEGVALSPTGQLTVENYRQSECKQTHLDVAATDAALRTATSSVVEPDAQPGSELEAAIPTIRVWTDLDGGGDNGVRNFPSSGDTPIELSQYVSGGIPPYTFRIVSGALPVGVSMDSDGFVHGSLASTTPEGRTPITIRVTDSKGHSAIRPTVFETFDRMVEVNASIDPMPPGYTRNESVWDIESGSQIDFCTFDFINKVGSPLTMAAPTFNNHREYFESWMHWDKATGRIWGSPSSTALFADQKVTFGITVRGNGGWEWIADIAIRVLP